MPDESPQPIHPLDAGLRAQAAKRRAELGAVEPSMPGPMRTQLQAEVSRQHARAHRSHEERLGFLAWFFQWQRALATVGVTLLVIGFFAWNEGWFARRDRTIANRPAENEKQSTEAGAVASREADAVAKRSDAPIAAMDAKEQAKPAPSSVAPSDALSAGKLEAAPKISQPAPPAVASAPPPAAPPASEPRSETFAAKSANVAGFRQNFVQSPAQVEERARRSAAKESKDERAAAVLNEFEFRQDGNRIEIVDADGSVYAGEIEARLKKDKALAVTGRDKAAGAPAGAAKPPGTKAKGEEVAADFNFRVSGMNNTLRQNVTIEGVYQNPALADQAKTPAAAAGAAASQEAQKNSQSQLQRQSQSRARVIGRAQVNGRDVQVDAEATK